MNTMIMLVDGQDREYEIWIDIDETLWNEFITWAKKINPSWYIPLWKDIEQLDDKHQDYIMSFVGADFEAFMLDTHYEELLEGEQIGG